MRSLLLLAGLVLCLYADSGKTTRYWDCCKGSCGWAGKASFREGPVKSCSVSNQPLNDQGNTQSGCNGGGAFMCSDQQPWAVNDRLSYGFAAAKLAGKGEWDWCCACYELTFTSGPVNGKKMIVQVTNTGGDLGNNHFDLAIPGGGVGIFNGCQREWNAPADGWGNRYGGVWAQWQCSQLPWQLQAGCNWRFGWFQNADNPDVSFRKVSCPREITDRTGCIRNDD